VDENVFAYSNRCGDDKVLVLYNNQYPTTSGWIKISAAASIPSGDSGKRELVRVELMQGLGLDTQDDGFITFVDQATGLEYLRSRTDLSERGLFTQLGGYEYHIFLNFRDIRDDHENTYSRLHEYLNGRGVPNLEDAIKDLQLQPVHIPFKKLIDPQFVTLSSTWAKADLPTGLDIIKMTEHLNDELKPLLDDWLVATRNYGHGNADISGISSDLVMKCGFALSLPDALNIWSKNLEEIKTFLAPKIVGDDSVWVSFWRIFYPWLILHQTGRIIPGPDYAARSKLMLEDWRLDKLLVPLLENLGADHEKVWQEINLIKILVAHQNWLIESTDTNFQIKLKSVMDDPLVREYLKFNWYDEVFWFSKEDFRELLYWSFLISYARIAADKFSGSTSRTIDADPPGLAFKLLSTVKTLNDAADHSGYCVDKFIKIVESIDFQE
jgi:hypothetical protein